MARVSSRFQNVIFWLMEGGEIKESSRRQWKGKSWVIRRRQSGKVRLGARENGGKQEWSKMAREGAGRWCCDAKNELHG